MNYEQFQKLLAEEVRRQSQGRVVVRPQKLSRNNGVTVDALEIRGAEEIITPFEQACYGEQIITKETAAKALEEYNLVVKNIKRKNRSKA